MSQKKTVAIRVQADVPAEAKALLDQIFETGRQALPAELQPYLEENSLSGVILASLRYFKAGVNGKEKV